MQLLRGRTGAIRELAVSPAGRYLAAVGFGCHVWDLQRPQVRPRVMLLRGGLRLWDTTAFLSETVLFGEAGAASWRFDFADDSAVELAARRLGERPIVAVNPARGVLKCVGQSGARRRVVTLPITPAGLGKQISSRRLAEERVPVMFSPDGSRYVSYGYNLPGPRRHLLCDADSDEPLAAFVADGQPDLLRGCFAPDGSRLYVLTASTVSVYDCAAGGWPLASAKWASRTPHCDADAHPGGRILATVEDDRHVTFRDAGTLEVLRRYDFAMPRLTAVAFTPDGTRCAIGNSKGKVLLFDVDD